MNEAEWLTCQNPDEVLLDSMSSRKWRLFYCACCRRIWDLISEVGGQTELEVAERFADGGVEDAEHSDCLYAAGEVAECLTQASHGDMAGYDGNYKKASIRAERSFAWAKQMAAEAIRWLLWHNLPADTPSCCPDVLAARATGWESLTIWAKTFPNQEEIGDMAADTVIAAAEGAERAYHSHLLKDLVGNPFRPTSITPELRTRTIRALAQAAYEERILPSGELDAVRLAVLADALEDAGCTNPDILDHLRGAGPHVRGCFVVDSCLDLT